MNNYWKVLISNQGGSWVNDNTEAKETKKVASKADVKTIKARGKNDINKDRTFFQSKPKDGEVHCSRR